MESKHILPRYTTDRNVLLIEPVWNRNIHENHFVCALLTFNRTSMESKPISNAASNADSRALLIEPVWNRNV